MTVGMASQHTGAGRQTKEDKIDLAAGIVLNKKVGDEVRKGDSLATLYSNDEGRILMALRETRGAFRISDTPAGRPALIKRIIGLD